MPMHAPPATDATRGAVCAPQMTAEFAEIGPRREPAPLREALSEESFGKAAGQVPDSMVPSP